MPVDVRYSFYLMPPFLVNTFNVGALSYHPPRRRAVLGGHDIIHGVKDMPDEVFKF